MSSITKTAVAWALAIMLGMGAAGAGIGPNGALYGTVYGGLTMLKDTY